MTAQFESKLVANRYPALALSAREELDVLSFSARHLLHQPKEFFWFARMLLSLGEEHRTN